MAEPLGDETCVRCEEVARQLLFAVLCPDAAINCLADERSAAENRMVRNCIMRDEMRLRDHRAALAKALWAQHKDEAKHRA